MSKIYMSTGLNFKKTTIKLQSSQAIKFLKFKYTHKERNSIVRRIVIWLLALQIILIFSFCFFPSKTLNTLLFFFLLLFYSSFKNSYKSQEFVETVQEGPEDPSPNFHQ